MSRQARSTVTNAENGGEVNLNDDVVMDTGRQASLERARPIPRISIQAFCESDELAEVIQDASEDRRLSKAHVSVHMGGVAAAMQHFEDSPTPNLIVVESSLPRQQLLSDLDRLASAATPEPGS